MNLYWMLLLHLLYDFHWQGQFVGTYKGKYPFIMFIHSLTYGLIVGLPYILTTTNDKIPLAAVCVVLLVISHFLIDEIKEMWIRECGEKMKFVYIDQAMHLFIILFIALGAHYVK